MTAACVPRKEYDNLMFNPIRLLRRRFTVPTTAANNDPVVERNIRLLYLEILPASVLGAIVTFNSAFAIRLGASQFEVALLTSIPALVGAIFSIPSARFLESRLQRSKWIFASLLLVRVAHIVIPMLPILFPSRQMAATALILWVIALNIPTIFFTNGWLALLGACVPEQRRAFVFSRRSILWSIGLIIVSALTGQWLDAARDSFPMNYQVIFALGTVIALASNYYVQRLTIPPGFDRTPDRTPESSKVEAADVARAIDAPAVQNAVNVPPARISPSMRKMLFNTAIYQCGLTIAAPLFNVYYIDQLFASDGWLGINAAAANAGVVVGYIVWERLLRRHSFEWGLKRATAFTWLFPIGIALFPNLTIIAIINFIVNALHPGVELSSINLMLKLAGSNRVTLVLSWYNTVLNISSFIAPLAGAFLVGPGIGLTIPVVLIIAGLFRIVGNLLFIFNAVQFSGDESTA